LRSYISTLGKQGLSVWDGLVSVFRGDVLMPDFSS
jgi:transposase